MRHYWMAFYPDGTVVTGNMCRTESQALDELKAAFRSDMDRYSHAASSEYYVTEFLELGDLIHEGPDTYYKLLMCKNGVVRCTYFGTSA